MSLPGQLLPEARKLDRGNQLVQEQIRKTQIRQDITRTHKAELQQKHAQRRQKILVVANRLPSSPKRDPDGNWVFSRCSGGLVSCLAGIQHRFDMVWIGWPGLEVAEEDKEMVCSEAMKQGCYPVFLSQAIIEDYYNGFANNVLWPLFHYIMPPFDKGVNECSTGQWEAYKKANEIFTETILQVYEDDDYVWIHDYHLMLVPKMLRESKPDCNIGWFLHTPFPSAEIYRTLPWRQEIIESLLHANLCGFHVFDYLRHFLSACVQLTTVETSAHSVDATSIGGCIVTCATVPIGIAPEDFVEALDIAHVKEQVAKLHDQYRGSKERRVILGIDRLDYMKGIPHKLRAFDCFLDMHPEWASQCVLVQLAVPSRRDVPEYQRLQRQVHELVGQICGKHSRLETGVPVIYLDASMSFHDLVALYKVADVCLITSLRDGMNLVSYEFVASHKGREPPGVLILSEFAGAAQSLGAGALRVNPWNLQETAESIYNALEMSREERVSMHRYAYRYITEHTSQKWAETFLQCLQEACSDLIEVTAEIPGLLPYEIVLTEWTESKRRLIIIDLLECLVPPKRRSGLKENRRKKALTLPPDLRESILTIANSPDTTVVLTTDKHRDALLQVAGNLPVILAPEGCTVYKRPCDRDFKLLVDELADAGANDEWMAGVEGVFVYFRERTPGSHMEKQELQYRWCWDNAQSDFGSAQAREVLIHLWAGPLVNSEAEVVVGDRSITVRPHAASRSACLERLLLTEVGEERLQKVDFALCFAAVSHRDEDVFETLQQLLMGPECTPEPSVTADEPLPSELLSPRSLGSCPLGERLLHTPPPGPAPPVKPGEPPPPYDWVPIVPRDRVSTADVPHGVEAHSPTEVQSQAVGSAEVTADGPISVFVLPPSSVASEERSGYCSCHTVTLGMRKTKAQHTLPNPYHVQNLLRAMATRLPQRPEEPGANEQP